MGGKQLAQFFELRGRRIIEAAGLLWYSAGSGLYMALPYQRRFEGSAAEAAGIITAARIVGLRFPSCARQGLPSGLYVRRSPYDFSSLHRNFKAKVKKGLGLCQVRRLEDSELMSKGLELNRQTLLRQERWDAEFGDEHRWRRFVAAMRRCPSIEAWGAHVDGILAAMVILCREDGWVHLLHKMCRTEYLEACPNHALDYCVTRDALADPGVEATCMGFQSLTSNPGLHEYKIRLGYEMDPLQSVIQFHPLLSPWLSNRAAHLAVRCMQRAWPRSQRLQLCEAVVRGSLLSRARSPGAARDGPERETSDVELHSH